MENVVQKLDRALGEDAALHAQGRGDLLGGVTVTEGRWADGSPLTAIPYYARHNRAPDENRARGAARSTVRIELCPGKTENP